MTKGEDGVATSVEQREADLLERESALAAKIAKLEAHRLTHLAAAENVCQAADERDVEADDRDRVAIARDHAADVKAFTSPHRHSGYGEDLPARRHAAMDRDDAKGDRTSAAGDRAFLADNLDDPTGSEEQLPE